MENKKIGHVLAQTLTVFKSNILAALKENAIELSIEQYGVLLLIDMEGLSSQQYIANELHKDKSIILRHINTLIEKDLVRKVSCKGDKRVKKACTYAGRERDYYKDQKGE